MQVMGIASHLQVEPVEHVPPPEDLLPLSVHALLQIRILAALQVDQGIALRVEILVGHIRQQFAKILHELLNMAV